MSARFASRDRGRAVVDTSWLNENSKSKGKKTTTLLNKPSPKAADSPSRSLSPRAPVRALSPRGAARALSPRNAARLARSRLQFTPLRQVSSGGGDVPVRSMSSQKKITKDEAPLSPKQTANTKWSQYASQYRKSPHKNRPAYPKREERDDSNRKGDVSVDNDARESDSKDVRSRSTQSVRASPIFETAHNMTRHALLEPRPSTAPRLRPKTEAIKDQKQVQSAKKSFRPQSPLGSRIALKMKEKRLQFGEVDTKTEPKTTPVSQRRNFSRQAFYEPETDNKDDRPCTTTAMEAWKQVKNPRQRKLESALKVKKGIFGDSDAALSPTAAHASSTISLSPPRSPRSPTSKSKTLISKTYWRRSPSKSPVKELSPPQEQGEAAKVVVANQKQNKLPGSVEKRQLRQKEKGQKQKEQVPQQAQRWRSVSPIQRWRSTNQHEQKPNELSATDPPSKQQLQSPLMSTPPRAKTPSIDQPPQTASSLKMNRTLETPEPAVKTVKSWRSASPVRPSSLKAALEKARGQTLNSEIERKPSKVQEQVAKIAAANAPPREPTPTKVQLQAAKIMGSPLKPEKVFSRLRSPEKGRRVPGIGSKMSGSSDECSMTRGLRPPHVVSKILSAEADGASTAGKERVGPTVVTNVSSLDEDTLSSAPSAELAKILDEEPSVVPEEQPVRHNEVDPAPSDEGYDPIDYQGSAPTLSSSGESFEKAREAFSLTKSPSIKKPRGVHPVDIPSPPIRKTEPAVTIKVASPEPGLRQTEQRIFRAVGTCVEPVGSSSSSLSSSRVTSPEPLRRTTSKGELHPESENNAFQWARNLAAGLSKRSASPTSHPDANGEHKSAFEEARARVLAAGAVSKPKEPTAFEQARALAASRENKKVQKEKANLSSFAQARAIVVNNVASKNKRIKAQRTLELKNCSSTSNEWGLTTEQVVTASGCASQAQVLSMGGRFSATQCKNRRSFGASSPPTLLQEKSSTSKEDPQEDKVNGRREISLTSRGAPLSLSEYEQEHDSAMARKGAIDPEGFSPTEGLPSEPGNIPFQQQMSVSSSFSRSRKMEVRPQKKAVQDEPFEDESSLSAEESSTVSPQIHFVGGQTGCQYSSEYSDKEPDVANTIERDEDVITSETVSMSTGVELGVGAGHQPQDTNATYQDSTWVSTDMGDAVIENLNNPTEKINKRVTDIEAFSHGRDSSLTVATSQPVQTRTDCSTPHGPTPPTREPIQPIAPPSSDSPRNSFVLGEVPDSPSDGDMASDEAVDGVNGIVASGSECEDTEAESLGEEATQVTQTTQSTVLSPPRVPHISTGCGISKTIMPTGHSLTTEFASTATGNSIQSTPHGVVDSPRMPRLSSPTRHSSPLHRSPRPWNLDRASFSPRGWHEFQKESYGSPHQPWNQKDQQDVSENGPSTPNSLSQMAALSIHAVDFDQTSEGVVIVDPSLSSSKEDSIDETSFRSTLPKEVPPEFGPLSSSGKLETDETSSGAVFGEPDTFGGAGDGGVRLSPRIRDRARALNDWKDGIEKLSLPKEMSISPGRRSVGGRDKEPLMKQPVDRQGEIRENGKMVAKSPGAANVLQFWLRSAEEDEEDEASEVWSETVGSSEDKKQALVELCSEEELDPVGEAGTFSFTTNSSKTSSSVDPFSTDFSTQVLNPPPQDNIKEKDDKEAFDPFGTANAFGQPFYSHSGFSSDFEPKTTEEDLEHDDRRSSVNTEPTADLWNSSDEQQQRRGKYEF